MEKAKHQSSIRDKQKDCSSTQTLNMYLDLKLEQWMVLISSSIIDFERSKRFPNKTMSTVTFPEHMCGQPSLRKQYLLHAACQVFQPGESNQTFGLSLLLSCFLAAVALFEDSGYLPAIKIDGTRSAK